MGSKGCGHSPINDEFSDHEIKNRNAFAISALSTDDEQSEAKQTTDRRYTLDQLAIMQATDSRRCAVRASWLLKE